VALKDVDECAEGAQITLKRLTGGITHSAETNNYGDFKIDDLERDSGEYSLNIAYPGYQPQELNVILKESINVGVLRLQEGVGLAGE
jgi:HSP20 family molecular chaperone IbpA